MEAIVMGGLMAVAYGGYVSWCELVAERREKSVRQRRAESGSAFSAEENIWRRESSRWRGCTFDKAVNRLFLTWGISRSRVSSSDFIRLRC